MLCHTVAYKPSFPAQRAKASSKRRRIRNAARRKRNRTNLGPHQASQSAKLREEAAIEISTRIEAFRSLLAAFVPMHARQDVGPSDRDATEQETPCNSYGQLCNPSSSAQWNRQPRMQLRETGNPNVAQNAELSFAVPALSAPSLRRVITIDAFTFVMSPLYAFNQGQLGGHPCHDHTASTLATCPSGDSRALAVAFCTPAAKCRSGIHCGNLAAYFHDRTSLTSKGGDCGTKRHNARSGRILSWSNVTVTKGRGVKSEMATTAGVPASSKL